jgi:hypothetical protein
MHLIETILYLGFSFVDLEFIGDTNKGIRDELLFNHISLLG